MNFIEAFKLKHNDLFVHNNDIYVTDYVLAQDNYVSIVCNQIIDSFADTTTIVIRCTHNKQLETKEHE